MVAKGVTNFDAFLSPAPYLEYFGHICLSFNQYWEKEIFKNINLKTCCRKRAMLGRRGSFRGSQPCLERRGSTSSLAASDGFLGRRRGSISSSAGAPQPAAGGRRGSLASSVANTGSSCPVEGKRGCASSNITVGLSNVKGGGGTLAMIALPIPAPRVRKVPIKLEREAPAEEVEEQGEGEDMGASKEKEEAGGGWKFRTGLSPGKWSTRSLRRSKEEMVAPLQRRNSLRGSFRIGRRGEEEENEQKDGGKKKPEGVGVKKKERRPLADLNKAEKERNPIAEKDRNAQSVEKERREGTKKEEKKGEKELRKPLAELLQSGGRRTSISGPHHQVEHQLHTINKLLTLVANFFFRFEYLFSTCLSTFLPTSGANPKS